jgi:adenine phosphoribosyltransferase
MAGKKVTKKAAKPAAKKKAPAKAKVAKSIKAQGPRKAARPAKAPRQRPVAHAGVPASLVPLKARIRSIPGYPKSGIVFRDITTLLQDSFGFRKLVDDLVQPHVCRRIDAVAGIEARGFIIGGAVAHQLSVGFIPVRKKGKLPWETIGVDYELEYGKDRIEIHKDAITQGQSVLLVDDLIATGGTAIAAIQLLRQAGANIVGCSFVIDLPDLGGRKRIEAMGVNVQALVEFDGE